MNPLKKSSQVALCGMIASLCVIFMFLTGVFPFMTYAIPALAGILMIAIVVECGAKWALLVYLAVSFLSVIVTPDRTAALMFIAFFGFYPILKSYIEQTKSRVVEYLVKFGIFNVCVVGAYLVVIYIFRLDQILEEFGMFGQYSVLALWLLGNITFFVYDIATTRLISAYVNWFRPKILRRMK